ncbi:winged helix-turn-helix domain-containing protein [Streptomyces sp. NPDC004647]|uniref:winged helix-turn-helix domain-containing protein n=1 Tax=Streptomyces sp. NPDC004647 TaxID=3154671 RepID=UPI0033A953F0
MVEITGRAMYRQVADDLRSKIREGVYPVGSPLPTGAKLMELYGVSITVIRAALKELRGDGITLGQQGKAVFVRDVPGEPEPSAADLAAVIRLLEQLGDRMDKLEKLCSGTAR